MLSQLSMRVKKKGLYHSYVSKIIQHNIPISIEIDLSNTIRVLPLVDRFIEPTRAVASFKYHTYVLISSLFSPYKRVFACIVVVFCYYSG
jgi:hypothetical protein